MSVEALEPDEIIEAIVEPTEEVEATPVEDNDSREVMILPPDSVVAEDQTGFMDRYIRPAAACLCCNTPTFAVQINRAYFGGMGYKEIITQFSDKVEAITGRSLTIGALTEHFENHLDFKAVAVVEYNRKYGMANIKEDEKKEISDIFSSLVDKRVNDLELLDLAMKEQIKRMKELEDYKQQRIKDGKLFKIDDLIMKQEAIMNNLQHQIMSKLKIWQKAKLQNKQMELIDSQLQFLDQKTATFLGLNVNTQQPYQLDATMAKEAERIYIKVVIESIIEIVKNSLDACFNLEPLQKAQFFRELTRQCKGIEKRIDEVFQIQIKAYRKSVKKAEAESQN